MGSTCPICFDDLDDKIKASPNACDHVFCLPCIEKWSKLGSYCPVDRKRYNKIINLDSENVIQVKPRKRKRTRVVYDFTTNCDICLKDDNSDTLLLCDCCDLGFHCRCLSPPLTAVPAGLWFCPTCITVEEKLKKKKGITKEVEADMGIDYGNVIHKQTEKETSLKCGNAGSSSNKQSTDVGEIFHDIISVFQGMNFDKRLKKDNCENSNNISFCDDEADKIFKAFNFKSKKTPEFTKNFKTYLGSGVKISDSSDSQIDNTNRTHLTETNISNTTDSKRKSKYFEIPDKDNIEPPLLCSVRNEDNIEPPLLCSARNKKYKLNESCEAKTTSNVKSKEKSKLSLRGRRKLEIYNKNLEEVNQDSGILCKQTKDKADVFVDTHECDLQNTSLKISDEVTKKKEKSRTTEPEVEESSLVSPDRKVKQTKSGKGTFSNLISDTCSKNVISDKRPNQFSKNGSINQDKKSQFSVFGPKEDIDFVQKKYAGTNTNAFCFFGSYANIGNCYHCNDKTFGTSQKFCRICKFKYSMRYSVLKHEKHLKCMNAVKDNSIPSKSDSSTAALNSNSHTLRKKMKNICRKSSMTALEWRQYSLSHALKKVHRNKWKSSESHN